MERTVLRRASFLAAAAIAVALGTSANARALRTLHMFSGPDGGDPAAGLVADGQGNFYGTTRGGGDNNGGTIFKLAADGTHSVIYSFGGKIANPQTPLVVTHDGGLAGATSDAIYKVSLAGHLTVLKHLAATGAAGSNPIGGLVEDAKGNLYGTTSEGAANACGAVFKLNAIGKLSVVYAFKGGQVDGCTPSGTLSRDAAGNLYGVTFAGGSGLGWGDGVLFKIAPDGAETVLHTFSRAGYGGDGGQPYGPLLLDATGDITGTTTSGDGVNAPDGTVYRYGHDGSYHVLHMFNYDGTVGFKDGAQPLAGVIADASGNLYGTTQMGGAVNLGTVFKLAPGGKLTLLHTFDSVDGVFPEGGLVADAHGNMFSTTADCGRSGSGPCQQGTIFELTQRKD